MSHRVPRVARLVRRQYESGPMTVGYRSILRLNDKEDAIQVARQQFRSWLAEMVKDRRKTIEKAEWDGPGTFQLGPDSVLTVVEHSDRNRLSRLLLEYSERNDESTWTTRLYAVSNPARRFQQTLCFESEGEDAKGNSLRPGTPRVVRYTLEAVDAFDGSVPILSRPRVVRSEEVDKLHQFIEDKNRNLSIVVVSPIPGIRSNKWAEAIIQLMRDSIGCASFFILDDKESNEYLNSKLGKAHSIPLGALRTFAPRVDLGDWADAKRHRILTARTMNDEFCNGSFSKRLVSTVATTPRRQLLEAGLPHELRRSIRVLQRERLRMHEITLRHITPDSDAQNLPLVNRPETGADWQGMLASFIQQVSGTSEFDQFAIEAAVAKFNYQDETISKAAETIETLRKDADKIQSERERLEDRVDELQRQLEEEQLERAILEEERRGAEKRLRSLEQWRSERVDKYEFVEKPEEDWESFPTNVSEIIERLLDDQKYQEVTKYVELSADVEKAIDDAYRIDEANCSVYYAQAFWEFILVLRDYVIECLEYNFNGGVHAYLKKEDVHGRKCPLKRHRSNESQTVQNNAKMRSERTFPVPENVDPSGKIFMHAHYAPSHMNQSAPRMYYFAHLESKKVYIGYIGAHLKNSKTN